jgi:hypothetical protein
MVEMVLVEAEATNNLHIKNPRGVRGDFFDSHSFAILIIVIIFVFFSLTTLIIRVTF